MDLDKLLSEKFTGPFRKGYTTANGFTLPQKYEELKEEIDNFEIHDEDVWVCSFPKTGTTWTQEMVWMIMNNLDFAKAKEILDERSPFFEFSMVRDVGVGGDRKLPLHRSDSISFTRSKKSPAVIKTHLPFVLLPKEIRNGVKKPKIIYISRDPKDTCVSYYHHSKLLEGFKGNFDEFCQLFLAGKVSYAPFWNHVLSFREHTNSPNVLFLKFEDMKKDLNGVIKTVAQFLERPLSEEQVQTLSKHLNFDNMKSNPAVNKEHVLKSKSGNGRFIRSGAVGGHKEAMTEEVVKKFDKWISESVKDSDLLHDFQGK